jgi:hypothetical protein
MVFGFAENRLPWKIHFFVEFGDCSGYFEGITVCLHFPAVRDGGVLFVYGAKFGHVISIPRTLVLIKHTKVSSHKKPA